MAEEALPAGRTAPRRVAPRSARRRSREFALQGLYQWQLAGAGVNEIKQHLSTVKGFDRADEAYFSALLSGVIEYAAGLEVALQQAQTARGQVLGCQHLGRVTAALGGNLLA